MPVWCTNRSLPWSSGVMKPKPLSSLNHLTVPVAMQSLPGVLCGRYVGGAVRQLLRNAGTTLLGRSPNLVCLSLAQEVGKAALERAAEVADRDVEDALDPQRAAADGAQDLRG